MGEHFCHNSAVLSTFRLLWAMLYFNLAVLSMAASSHLVLFLEGALCWAFYLFEPKHLKQQKAALIAASPVSVRGTGRPRGCPLCRGSLFFVCFV